MYGYQLEITEDQGSFSDDTGLENVYMICRDSKKVHLGGGAYGTGKVSFFMKCMNMIIIRLII